MKKSLLWLLLQGWVISEASGQCSIRFLAERASVQEFVEKQEGVYVPVSRITIDYLGMPVGLPFKYASVAPAWSVENSPSFAGRNTSLKKIDGLKLRNEAYLGLKRLKNSAALSGIKLEVSSAFRNGAFQASLYRKLGSNIAERTGYSEHQLGTTVDFTAVHAGSKTFLWLLENAFRQGWIPSYYFRENTAIKKEPWHWRFVGPEAAEEFYCIWQNEISQEVLQIKERFAQ
ncbi:D-alanyl-D-alanine carboxypeptidase family protein [Limibacter armeniacum]|uniref:M15 family metallopeptidase n=1 Tax=Limibacter armeniacum TaxID=466084 RepID=UPI002FE695F0